MYRPQCGIFSITHNNKVICNMQLQTTPLLLGDTIQLAANFADTEIPCEQVGVSVISHADDHLASLRRVLALSEGTDRKKRRCEFDHGEHALDQVIPLLL